MRYLVRINGKEYDVEVEKLGGPYQSLTRGTAYMQSPVAFAQAPQQAATPAPVPVAAPAAPPAPVSAPEPALASAAVSSGGEDITSPMPGKVFKLVAKDGDSVSQGDVVMILEAMKMENEIVATASGTITFVKKEGDMVETDDVLATIK